MHLPPRDKAGEAAPDVGALSLVTINAGTRQGH